MSDSEFTPSGCFLCGLPNCNCECQQSPLCGCGKCVQAIRAEVTGLRKENRELHKQDAMREDEIAALKAALAEARTRLQALMQASVAAAHMRR